METRTISFHIGKNNEYKPQHNRRSYKNSWPDNIDRSRTADNITLVDERLENAYHALFDESIKEYNSKQTRKDRQKSLNYLQELKKSGKNPNYVYEAIVQFGNKDNTAQDNTVAVETLKQYVKEFRQRNPQLHIIGAYIHLDEATPHLHLDWIPVGPNMGHKARGPALQASMDKALVAQGYTQGKGPKETPLAKWTADERAAYDAICTARGYNVIHPEAGTNRRHIANIAYQRQQEEAKLAAIAEQTKAAIAQLNELTGKEEIQPINEMLQTKESVLVGKKNRIISMDEISRVDTLLRNFIIQQNYYKRLDDKNKYLQYTVNDLKSDNKKLQQKLDNLYQQQNTIATAIAQSPDGKTIPPEMLHQIIDILKDTEAYDNARYEYLHPHQAEPKPKEKENYRYRSLDDEYER